MGEGGMGAGGVVEDVEAGGLGVRDLDAEDMEERVWCCGVGVGKRGGRFSNHCWTVFDISPR